jgi:hypothetical protein
MMNESVREWFRVHTEFLYTLVFKNELFYIDFWSLVHIWSGLILFTILIALNVKRKWFWFIFLISIYELAEVAFIYFALHIFRPERLNDQVLDIFVGVFAACLCNFILLYRSSNSGYKSLPKWALMLFSSITFAFVWVGNYRYEYNFAILNTPGINRWAFFSWLAGGFIFLTIYSYIKSKQNNLIKQLAFTWLVYFVLLLLLEYIGYYIIEIREISATDAKPLIFGLIHGNLSLHIYYSVFPFLIIYFYELLVKLVTKAQFNLVKIKNKV